VRVGDIETERKIVRDWGREKHPERER